MQMGDKIVVMNHGVVEQFGTPQDIYDHPATMFVADFIGSPSMNFLPFVGSAPAGATSVRLDTTEVGLPTLHEAASGKLVLGVRPEHIRLSDDATYRGRIEAAEYLGTTQILTLSTPNGTIRARTPSAVPAVLGANVGLHFAAPTLSLFDESSGRAYRTAANAGVLHG
jgi:multiple sugar transport system ATP-binding protein